MILLLELEGMSSVLNVVVELAFLIQLQKELVYMVRQKIDPNLVEIQLSLPSSYLSCFSTPCFSFIY